MNKFEHRKSNADFESAVKPFIIAMSVPEYRKACRILFVNKNLLTLSEEFGQIGIISCCGPQDDIKKITDLIISDSKTELALEFQKVFPELKRFIDPIISATVGVISVESESEKQSLFVAKIIEKFESENKMQVL